MKFAEPEHGEAPGRHPGGDEPERRDARSSTTPGRERERYQVIYGAKLLVKEGQKVDGQRQIAGVGSVRDSARSPRWAGIVRFDDIIEGVTMNETLDEVTGLSRKTIIESKDPEARPRITIRGEQRGSARPCPAPGSRPATTCRRASIITVNDGDDHHRPAR